MMKATSNIPALVMQAAELHVGLIFSDGEFVDLIFSEGKFVGLIFSDDESVDLNFSLRYSAMKVMDRISSTTNNIIKTKRTLEGFRVSGSPKERKGILAISVYFSIFSFNLLNHDSTKVFFKECRTYDSDTPNR
jgi:hypothetical protein